MTCSTCKIAYENDSTHHVSKNFEAIIIIKNVPCLKCPQCGEVAYTLDVAERLSDIVDSLKNSVMEIAVTKYTEANTAA